MKPDLSKLICDKGLTEAEAAVLSSIADHGVRSRGLGVRALAAECFTSTSTVMRLAHKLGYEGFVDMCYRLPLEEVGDAADTLAPIGAETTFQMPLDMNLSFPVQDRAAIGAVAHRLHRLEGFVQIYGCGYSSIFARYLSKKLLGLGVKALLSTADDSISIFENNLDRTDSLIVVTRSGRTPYVLDRVRTAADEGIFSVAFTGDHDSPVRQNCDFSIVATDEREFDDRNTEPSLFFSRMLVLMEYLVNAYIDLERVR